MIKIFEAQNSVEAHLILNLFEQAGLTGRIDGEYLQGGMGELQVSDIVRVMIVEDDYEKGKEIIRQWETKEIIEIESNLAIKTSENKPNNSYLTIKWKNFILIIIVSLFAIMIINGSNQGHITDCFPGAKPMIKTNINNTTIIQVTEEIQKLLSVEFKNRKNSIQGTSLGQAGLVDGNKIILEYIKHGEIGIALEHLFYMQDALQEVNTSIPQEISDNINLLNKEYTRLNIQRTYNNN